MPSILVVDDELSIRESFSLILKGKHAFRVAASGEAALKIVADQKVDMVYLDIRMPGMDGLETLKRLKEIDPDLEIIMVTAVNDVQKAGEAVKRGARDYVVKPFDVDHILKLTDQILRKKALLQEGSEVQKKAGEKIPELIGQNEKILQLSKAISRIKKDERVLILGEIGTEKQVVAQIIHEKSNRKVHPFRSAYLSPAMSVAEKKTLLFGWEKGGSTVDLDAKSGILEQAGKGSIFINHLEFLPEEIFKPLSSLEFSRMGGTVRIPIEARLIGGATPRLAERNKELFDYFAKSHFQLPPLRERASDIPLLVNHFKQKFGDRYEKDVSIDAAVIEALANYSWPGNIQQLESLMEQLILSSPSGQLELDDLPLEILIGGVVREGSDLFSTFEKEYIREAFEKNGTSEERTAAFLGINPLLLEDKL